MFPLSFLTVKTPFATVHCAGVVVSFVITHWLRSFPLNKTMASDGGSEKFLPGVTCFGTGSHISVSSGFILCCCAVATMVVPLINKEANSSLYFIWQF